MRATPIADANRLPAITDGTNLANEVNGDKMFEE